MDPVVFNLPADHPVKLFVAHEESRHAQAMAEFAALKVTPQQEVEKMKVVKGHKYRGPLPYPVDEGTSLLTLIRSVDLMFCCDGKSPGGCSIPPNVIESKFPRGSVTSLLAVELLDAAPIQWDGMFKIQISSAMRPQCCSGTSGGTRTYIPKSVFVPAPSKREFVLDVPHFRAPLQHPVMLLHPPAGGDGLYDMMTSAACFVGAEHGMANESGYYEIPLPDKTGATKSVLSYDACRLAVHLGGINPGNVSEKGIRLPVQAIDTTLQTARAQAHCVAEDECRILAPQSYEVTLTAFTAETSRAFTSIRLRLYLMCMWGSGP